MRRAEFFVFAAAVFSLGAVDGASSGDLLPQVYAPPLSNYMWTNCYGGLNAGGIWSPSVDALRSNPGSFTVGGQVGCNRAWSSFVWGGEADLQYTGLNGSRDEYAPDASVHQDFHSRWLATFRGRAGWLAAPNVYLYATGGLALVNNTATSSVTYNGTINNLSDSTTHAGWTAGAGLEWMFTPQWSAKVEYLYVDIGHATNPLPISNKELSSIFNRDLSFTENIFRVGINYHFYPW
jgi:outer membrane immunogenic protein